MAVLPRFASWDNGRDDSSSGASSNHGRSWVWSTCTSLCGDRIAFASGGVLDLKRLTGASTMGQTPTLSRAGYGPGKRRAFTSKCAGYMMLLTEGSIAVALQVHTSMKWPGSALLCLLHTSSTMRGALVYGQHA